MSDTLIKVENVSKKFSRSLKKSLLYGTTDLCNELIGRRHGGYGKLRDSEFWAINAVSFEVRRGECLGLVGRNGAGKTTLLRMLNGLIKPDEGRIELRGRIGAMIALGAGFNPVLTGRENIYVNAAVLGLSTRETEKKIAEIIGFSELGDFIDAPVQTYSSGMVVRLGFSIAAIVGNDILLLDEILAVGDTKFRMKCLDVMRDKLDQGVAAILVSHNVIDLARACDRGLHLEKGTVAFFGDISKTIASYQTAFHSSANNIHVNDSKNALFVSLRAVNYKGEYSAEFKTGERLRLVAELELRSEIKKVRFNLHIDSPVGMLSSESSLLSCGEVDLKGPGRAEIRIEIPDLNLLNGVYTLWIDMYGPGLADYYTRSMPLQISMGFDKYDPYGYGACHIILPKSKWVIINSVT